MRAEPVPRRLFYVLLPMLSLAGQAIAHPHVFVDADVGFAVNGTRLDSLRIAWTYDEFTTLVLFDILDLDADGDGVLTDDDLAKVVKGETDWPEGYDGDVHLEVGGVPVALTRPTNASAEMRDDRMVVVFDLPLEAPLDLPATRRPCGFTIRHTIMPTPSPASRIRRPMRGLAPRPSHRSKPGRQQPRFRGNLRPFPANRCPSSRTSGACSPMKSC